MVAYGYYVYATSVARIRPLIHLPKNLRAGAEPWKVVACASNLQDFFSKLSSAPSSIYFLPASGYERGILEFRLL